MRLAALVVLALALVACGPGATAASTARGTAGPTHDVLALLVGGIEEPLAPGQRVPLSGDLVAQLTLRAGADATTTRVLEIDLSRGGGTAVVATIHATGHMRYMDHGSFVVAAVSDGDGHYLVPLPFAMSGEWTVDLAIATDPTTVALPLALSVIR